MRDVRAGGHAGCNGFGRPLTTRARPDAGPGMAGQRAAEAMQKERAHDSHGWRRAVIRCDRQPEPAARGRLRIYLGYAPGAGTTCALLREGHRRAEHGTDVVVAIAETHGRPHTEALLAGLEIIPPANVPYQGTTVEEIDLGAVLARRPAVALVDDLAHCNVPGAGHARRWQDAGELLAAGIDVISTVCIGQLESLSDVVEKITGVPHRETVPDPVVRTAGEVELVDVAPQALQERLAHGHIYPAERAGAALGSWFQTPNLSALRELALLWLAGKLASDRRESRPGGPVPGDHQARERVVVALSGGPEGETLIRRAARIAAWSAGDLLAVHAAGPAGQSAAGRAALAAQRQLTVSLGGTYHELADSDIPAALLAFAQAADATALVLGVTRRTRLAPPPLATTIRSQLIRRGGGIGVHIVSCLPTANGGPPAEPGPDKSPDKSRRTVTQRKVSWPGRLRAAARRGRGGQLPGQESLPPDRLADAGGMIRAWY
jgi:two-component system sensor histidine kinase KdpD